MTEITVPQGLPADPTPIRDNTRADISCCRFSSSPPFTQSGPQKRR